MDNKHYFKITNAQENHHGFQYVDGLNILDKPFEEKGYCAKGGLYFSDAEHILEFLDFGVYLREVTLPISDPDFKMVKDPGGNKWRANKIILGKRYDLSDISAYEFLISLGADIENYHYLIIHHACCNGHLEIFKLFSKKTVYCGGNNGYYNYSDYLIYACRRGHLELTRFLIEKGADPSYNNYASIKEAFTFEHMKVIKLLIECNANFGKKILKNGMILACKKGNLELVELLVEKGIDLRYGNDLYMKSACEYGQIEIVKFLINKGVHFRDNCDYAIKIASINGHIEIVKYFVESTNFRPEITYAIRHATKNNNVDIVNYLTKIKELK